MTWQNLDDVVDQLRGAGLMLDSVKKSNGGTLAGQVYIESSKSVRCDIDGEKKRGSGAYWLHELRLDDGNWITGSYWLDHGNTSFKLELRKTCAKCGADIPLRQTTCTACGSKQTKAREIPKEQIEAHKARMAEARRQAEAEAKADAERAAAWANAVWLKCREIFSADEHDYLARKNLKSAHGARVFDSNDGIILTGDKDECADAYKYLANFHGALVVPMLDKDGRRRGLQFILSREKHRELITKRDGRDKEYWPRGMLKAGLHYTIGGSPRGVCLVAEGYATAASLHEATNLPVAVAFDANNLGPVGAIIWKSNRKRVKLLYTADDDWLQRCAECKQITPVADTYCKHCGKPHGKQNAGVERAKEAALATSGAWVIPQFSAPRPDNKKGPTDFNDLRCAEGEQIVGAQIAGKLAALEWTITPPLVQSARAGDKTTGEGEAQLAMLTSDEVVSRFSPVWSTEDVYYFDHRERVVCSRQSLAARMPRSGWDQVTSHPDWRTKPEVPLSGVDFDPTESDREVVYNLWGGWKKITRPPGASCDAILALLHHLCSFEQENHQTIYEWMLKWLAYPLQYPGAKMQSCILMHGTQGAGKNTVFDAVLEMYGKEYAVEFGPKQLEKRFNALFSKKMLAIGNEIVASREDLYHVKGHIKHMITERRWVVEAKNKDERWERNCCNFIFLSNELNPQALDKGDRRHCVIWTPHVPAPHEDAYATWTKLWSEAHAERKNGGHAALYYHLMQLDLTGFTEATWPPMTQAKQDLIDSNMDSRERFWRGYLEETIEGIPCVPCTTDDFYSAYRAWAGKAGISRCAPEHSLAAFIGKQPNMIRRQERFAIGATVEKKTVIHPHNLTDPPPDKTKSAWLGDCVTEFRKFLTELKGS